MREHHLHSNYHLAIKKVLWGHVGNGGGQHKDVLIGTGRYKVGVDDSARKLGNWKGLLKKVLTGGVFTQDLLSKVLLKQQERQSFKDFDRNLSRTCLKRTLSYEDDASQYITSAEDVDTNDHNSPSKQSLKLTTQYKDNHLSDGHHDIEQSNSSKANKLKKVLEIIDRRHTDVALRKRKLLLHRNELRRNLVKSPLVELLVPYHKTLIHPPSNKTHFDFVLDEVQWKHQ